VQWVLLPAALGEYRIAADADAVLLRTFVTVELANNTGFAIGAVSNGFLLASASLHKPIETSEY
jgi:hypothetical protein